MIAHREYRYASALSLTLVLDGEWMVTATVRLLYLRGNDPTPIVYEAG
jgi:hypothetical protein